MEAIKKQARLAQYKSGESVIRISFPYDPMDVARVKLIPGRKYNPNSQVWTCPISSLAIDMLDTWDWEIDHRLASHLAGDLVKIDELKPLSKIKGLKMDLYPYQKKGVAFIEAKKGRALIADEMGLGKTAQALAWCQMHPEKRPVLIVVPASLKLNWKKEVRMWMSKQSVLVLSGTSPHNIPERDIVIINYDILAHWLPTLLQYKFEVIIGDEIHYVKNNKAKRTKAMRKIAKTAPHFIALSGTPIVNRPIEFYNAIRMLDPTLFPNYQDFIHRYCGAKHNGFGWNTKGATNTKELHETLTKTIMIRRKKSEVLTELPDKVHSFFPLEMDTALAREYRDAETDFINWVQDNRGDEAAEKAGAAAALAEIEVLKQLSAQAKMNHAMEWIHDFLESGEKLVVFATHKFVIEKLMGEFGDVAVKIDGSVNNNKRQVAVDEFQNNDKIKLFVGNIQAAGVGITLTAASNVAFLELPWTPGALVQAEDRCHRIGQKDTVNIYYLLAEDTIEEKIAALLDEKRKVMDAVLDGEDTEDSSLLMSLMEDYSPTQTHI